MSIQHLINLFTPQSFLDLSLCNISVILHQKYDGNLRKTSREASNDITI